MGGGIGSEPGGIRSLARIIKHPIYGEAIRYDVFKTGRTLEDLGTTRFSWLDLRALIRYSDMDTAYARVSLGENAGWGLTQHLLAIIADQLAGANWQRSGGKGAKPKPLPRPTGTQKKVRKARPASIDMDAIDKALGYSLRDRTV